jgi:hypothetical protein
MPRHVPLSGPPLSLAVLRQTNKYFFVDALCVMPQRAPPRGRGPAIFDVPPMPNHGEMKQ